MEGVADECGVRGNISGCGELNVQQCLAVEVVERRGLESVNQLLLA